jgi:predicted acylesterase/phospholipase RssA
MLLPPKRIVFTGGGLRSLCHFGVLEVLKKKGLLNHVREYVGVSAGALVGFATMLGYTIEEMKQVVTEFDFTLLQTTHPELVLDFFSTYGVDTGEQLEKFLKALLRIKGHSIDMTFGEWAKLYPKAKRLRCYATNLNTCKLLEFSCKTTPDISFVFALRASMSLPLYFTPVSEPETGHYLVDGGVIHNFPMNYLTEEEKEETLGVSFLYSKQGVEEIGDFVGFLTQLYNCGFNPRTYQVQQDNKLQCIIIPTGKLSAYNFDLTKEFRQELIDIGKQAAEDFCKNYLKLLFQHRKPARRYSVS